jgi:hypothetical protein
LLGRGDDAGKPWKAYLDSLSGAEARALGERRD